MPVAHRRSQLLRTRLDRFTRMLPGVAKGDVLALHQARVATRRLREILPILQLEADAARKLGRRLRRVTRRLGEVRELDVLPPIIEELRASHDAHADALTRVGAAIAKARDEAWKDLEDRLPADDLERLSRKLDRVLEALRHDEKRGANRRSSDHDKAAVWAIDARVAHRAARLGEALERSTAVYLPERLHDARIATKKLRYALELSGAMGRAGVAPVLRTLKRSQDILGRMHDLQVLIDRVREVQASLIPPSLPVWRHLDALVVAVDAKCRVLHARYLRARPGLQSAVDGLTASEAKAAAGARQAG
jgi:CHAD domain-containing protein